MNHDPQDIPDDEVPESVKKEWVAENWDRIMDHFLEDIEDYNAKLLEEQRDDAAEARSEARKEVRDNS